MRRVMVHISNCFLLLCLVEGRITATPSKDDDDEVPTSTQKMFRKRTGLQVPANNLEPMIHDEFGNNFFDEDNIAWNRILGQTSFTHEHCDVEVDVEVNCYLQDEPSLSCKEYMDIIGYDISRECNVPIVYEYVVTNIGTATDKITKIKTAINSERPFTYITNSVPLPKRTLVPGQYLTATQRRSLNFCESYNQDINFEVGVECTEGDPKMFYPKITFEERPPSCNAKLELACEDEDGGPCVSVKKSSSGICNFRPYYFDFLFSGGKCAASMNNQGSRFWCKDNGDVTGLSTAFIVVEGKKNKKYFVGYVKKGDVFTVGSGWKVDSDMFTYILDAPNGNVLQSFKFHSSCSKDLALNDTFGGITIAGFRDGKQNVSLQKTQPSQYKFTYKILNNGPHSINLKNIVFSSGNIQDTKIFDIERGNTNISPLDSLSRSSILAINGTSADVCLQVEARLKYIVLPSHNSKICFAQAQFGSSKGGKRKGKGKGRRKSSMKCTVNGKGKNSKGGKGKNDKKGKSKGKNDKKGKGKGKIGKKGKGKGK